MTKKEIFEFLKNKTNWTKDVLNKDLWSYINISETLKVGRQKYDWSIFKRNKNQGFYFTESYAEIPEEIIEDLHELIKQENQ